MKIIFYDKVTYKICKLLILIIIGWYSITGVKADEDKEILEAVKNSINIPELENSCNAGNLKTCQRLACLYDGRNRAFDFNYDNAIHYYTKSCEMGSPYSCLNLAENQDPSTENDAYKSTPLYRDSIKTIENRCTSDDANACLVLGALTAAEFEGSEAAKSQQPKASQYYRKSCDTGNAYGCWLYGMGSTNLGGIDSPRRLKILRKGCEMDNSRGAADSCYSLAISLKLNDTEAEAEKYKKLSAKKNAIACENGSQFACGTAAANVWSDDEGKDKRLIRRYRELHVSCTNTDYHFD